MDSSIRLLHAIMNGCSARHNVLADNLANAQTPQFSRQDIDFQKTLMEAMSAQDPAKLRSVKFEAQMDRKSPAAPNGNNVSTQQELGMIMQNSLMYNAAVMALSKKLAGLKTAIKGQ